MWHEARKQEKKIRDAMVDFQKRAERRRQHYEKKVCAYMDMFSYRAYVVIPSLRVSSRPAED